MARSPSLRKLRYFVAVAESGKVTQAAVDLNVSQSSITTGVREIEDELGVKLFDRQAQGMVLGVRAITGLLLMAALEPAAGNPASSRQECRPRDRPLSFLNTRLK